MSNENTEVKEALKNITEIFEGLNPTLKKAKSTQYSQVQMVLKKHLAVVVNRPVQPPAKSAIEQDLDIKGVELHTKEKTKVSEKKDA